MPIDLDTLVAQPGFAPHEWQSKCPDFARDGGHKPPVAPHPEIDRIAALPRRAQPVEGSAESNALIAFMNARFGKPNASCKCAELGRECITSLRLVQAWTLLELGTMRGVFGAIGVGHGKTMLDLLAPLAMPGCRTAVLLVPPGLVSQLIHDYQLVGQHFQMPSLITHDKNAVSLIVPGAPALHVFPYSRLSRPESSDYLEQALKPDFIISDECHKLRAADTATVGRVLRYFRDHPDTRFACWSGSSVDKTIKNAAHLMALALRLNSPLPIDPEVVEDVARAVDPPTLEGERAPEGYLSKLCEKGEHYLHAFHRRMIESPGVIATRSAAVDAEIIVNERVPPPIPKVGRMFVPPATVAERLKLREGEHLSVAAALRLLEDHWMRPDGEEFPDALARARAALEISCGFFNRWRFPLVRDPATGKLVPQNIATILDWLAKRAEWNREVRYAIRSRREHFDSERLARNAAERAWGMRPIGDRKLPVWRAASFPAWAEVENAVVYETEAIWLDDWLARDAAEWALEHRGIVWYAHVAFGEAVAKFSGLPLHGGGADAGELIGRVTGETSIIASIKSHGTGRDGLQLKYQDQLIANFPSTNDTTEQLLGRLHRIGQKSKTVRADFYRHTRALARNVNQALNRAGFVETFWGSEQKLNLSGVVGTDTDEDEWDLE